MEKLTFRQCSLTLLNRHFGLRQTFSSQLLDQWLHDEQPLTEIERLILKTYQEALLIHHHGWNGQELSLNFIGPVLALARFWDPYRYNFFAGRHLQIEIDGLHEKIELSGDPDGMIATGYIEPEIPIFAFMEHKRELESSGDPAGQTVAAMLVGQKLNQQEQPIYGCYVIGAQWFFIVLEGKHYTISQGYLATNDSLFEIFRILKALKAIVIMYTAE